MLNITQLQIILTENNHSGALRVNKKGTQVQQKNNLALFENKMVPKTKLALLNLHPRNVLKITYQLFHSC